MERSKKLKNELSFNTKGNRNYDESSECQIAKVSPGIPKFLVWVCLLVIIFQSHPIQPDEARDQWVVWNVGQGQWITRVKGPHCWHFDFGGEKNPIREVRELCRWKKNFFILSHEDRDHYSFLPSAAKHLPRSCLYGPSWHRIDEKKVAHHGLPFCDSEVPLKPTLIHNSPEAKSLKETNAKSQWASFDHWLLTGDSSKKGERDKVEKIKDLDWKNLEVFILGHHGSRYSNSLELLQKLKNLHLCISSSRFKKYGHPHQETIKRIKPFCPLLRTEDWHHIHIFDKH